MSVEELTQRADEIARATGYQVILGVRGYGSNRVFVRCGELEIDGNDFEKLLEVLTGEIIREAEKVLNQAQRDANKAAKIKEKLG